MRVFKDDELRYSARARCRCGAGLCYIEDHDVMEQTTGRAWVCSLLLTRDVKMKITKPGHLFGGGIIQTEDGAEHDQSYPFMSYEIKSEIQPSQGGATTRPNGMVYHSSCGQPAFLCKCSKMPDLEVRYDDANGDSTHT